MSSSRNMMKSLFKTGMLLSVLLVAPSLLLGADQYWNPTTTKQGAGSGVWATDAGAWANTSAGTTNPIPWVNGNSAQFILNYGVNTATVNNVSASLLLFNRGTYVFEPGTGPLTLTGAVTNSGETVSVTFKTDITLAADQTWYMTKPTTVYGILSGPYMLTKAGSGTLTLSNANNQVSGLTVESGPVQAFPSGTVLGKSTAGLTLGTPSQALLSQLTLNTIASGNTTYSVGDVTNAGAAQLFVKTVVANSTNAVTAGNLVRAGRGTLVVSPDNALGTREQVTFTGGAISPVNGMLDPWTIDSKNATYMTYSGGLTDIVFDAGVWDNTKKINITATTNLAQDASVYALKVGADVSIGTGVTLTNASGGLILGANVLGNGTLSFGAAELLAYVTGTRILGSAIYGSGGLTVFGGGTLVVSNMTYTGDTWINHGVLTVSPQNDTVYRDDLFGTGELIKDGATSLTLAGSTSLIGKLTINGSGIVALTNSIVSTRSGVTLGTTASTLILANAQLRNAGTLATSSGKSNITVKVLGGGAGSAPTVLDGGLYGITIGNANGSGNSLLVDGGGITGGAMITNMIFNTSGLAVGSYANSASNTVMIANGGAIYDEITVNNVGNNMGVGAGANGNQLNVIGGSGFVSTLRKGMGNTIGSGAATGNVVRVDAKGIPGSAVWLAPANDSFTVGSSGGFGNKLEILNGAKVTGGGLICGSDANSNRIEIAGNSTEWKGNGGGAQFTIGVGNSEGNTVVISDGAYVWNFTTWQGAIGGRGPSLGAAAGKTSIGNSLIITNGGVFNTVNDTYIGHQGGVGASSLTNQVIVTGLGSLWASSSYLYLGASTTGSKAVGNRVVVEKNGKLTGTRRLLIGSLSATDGTLANDNGLIIRSEGIVRIPYHDVYGVHGLEIGSTVTNSGNIVNAERNFCLVTDNGVLDIPVLYILSPGGNYIRIEKGGVWQLSGFRSPTIKSQQFGDISMDNGIVSFAEGTSNFTVRDNWNFSSWTNVQFTGNNGLRLNGITLGTTSDNSYLFESNISPTNWAFLQMVNGTTVYQTRQTDTGALTIGEFPGSNAEMLCSNTTALVAMPFVLNGKLRLVNSTLTITTNATVNGEVFIDLANASGSGPFLAAQKNLTLGDSSTLRISGAPVNGQVLMTYSGTRTGKFKVEGLPKDYTIKYDLGEAGTISILHTPTVITIR